ncbi:MAG: ABC transporter permease [Fervidicoccaceae archaeon]
MTLLGWFYLLFFIVAIWALLHELFPTSIPGYSSVLLYMEQAGLNTIISNIGKTLLNTASGFLLSLLLTLISLIAYYSSSHFALFIEAFNTFVQSVSALVWALIFLLIFGLTSNLPPISVVTATSYPILLTLALNGSKVVLEKYGDMAKVMGARKRHLLRYFILPGSFPYVVGGSRAAVGSALRISVVAEALGSSGGVGYMLVYCYDIGNKGGVFAWSILLVLLMIVLDEAILRPMERWSMNWMS